MTGPVSDNMRLALRETWEAVPAPKIVIAVGACAISGGPFSLSTTANNNIVNGAPVFTFDKPFAAAGVPGTLNLNGIAPDLRNQVNTQFSFTIEIGRASCRERV